MGLMTKLNGLLFENTTWKQTLLKNVFWATGSEGVLRITRIVTVTLMVRWLGPTEYGYFAYAFAFTSMFSIVSDPGTSTALTRIISAKPAFIRFLPSIIAFKLLQIALAMVLILVAASATALSRESWMVTLIMGVFLAAQEMINLSFVVFRALNQFQHEFAIRFGQSLATMVVVLASIYFSPLGRVAALSQTLVAIAASLVVIKILTKDKLRGDWFRHNWRIGKYLLLSSLPIAFVNGAGILYASVDIVLLGLYRPVQEMGLYSAAVRLLYIAQLPTAIVGIVIFPTLSAGIKKKSPENQNKWAGLIGGMTFLSIPATLVTVVCATDVVNLIFGSQYDESARILQIMALGLPALYIYPMFIQVLMMIGMMRPLVIASVGSAALIALIFGLLIKGFGSVGAAFGLVLTNYLLAFVFGAMISMNGHFKVIRPMLTSRNAAAMLSAVFVVTTLSLFWGLATGVLRIVACVGLFAAFYAVIVGVRWMVTGRSRVQL